LFGLIARTVLAILMIGTIDSLAPNGAAIAVIIAANLVPVARAAFVAQLALVLAISHASTVGTGLI
jgi:hypothetical protein